MERREGDSMSKCRNTKEGPCPSKTKPKGVTVPGNRKNSNGNIQLAESVCRPIATCDNINSRPVPQALYSTLRPVIYGEGSIANDSNNKRQGNIMEDTRRDSGKEYQYNDGILSGHSTRDWEKIAESKDIGSLIIGTGDWRREKGFETGWANFAEKLMLIITELNETTEAFNRECSYNEIPCLSYLGIDEDNYVEEWIDVAVRTIDLIEACNIGIGKGTADIIRKEYSESITDLILKEDYESREAFYDDNVYNCWSATSDLAKAMEAFRDINLKEINGKMQPYGPTNGAVDTIRSCLSNVVYATYSTVRERNRSWWSEYARKMKKNEQRPAKHGRKR